MAKLFGFNGLAKGKIGGTVYVIRNGAQIARQYNPSPYQPKSENQAATRARFKLLNQLAEVLAPVMAMPREGLVSPRNLFVSRNYPASAYENSQASIDLNKVQLTRSVVGMPRIISEREGTSLRVRLAFTSGVDLGFDSVVYVVVAKGADEKLRILSSSVVLDPDTGGYPTEFSLSSASAEVVVYAYGIKMITERARMIYGEMQAVRAEQIAKLIVSRSFMPGDYQLTETVGVTSGPAAVTAAAPANTRNASSGDSVKKS